MKPFILRRDDTSFHFRPHDRTLMKIQLVVENPIVEVTSVSYPLVPTLAEDMKFEGGGKIGVDDPVYEPHLVTFTNGREFYLTLDTARRFWNELVTKGFTRIDA